MPRAQVAGSVIDWYRAADPKPPELEGRAFAVACEEFASGKSPSAQLMLDGLIRASYPRLLKMLTAGDIFEIYKRKWPGHGIPVAKIPENDYDDLILEMCAAAARRFESHHLRGLGWQPNRGTALLTWFVDDCIAGFSNAWSKVFPRVVTERSIGSLEETLDVADPRQAMALLFIEQVEDRAALINRLPEKLRAVADMADKCSSHDEIAQALALPRTTVSTRLAQARKILAEAGLTPRTGQRPPTGAHQRGGEQIA